MIIQILTYIRELKNKNLSDFCLNSAHSFFRVKVKSFQKASIYYQNNNNKKLTKHLKINGEVANVGNRIESVKCELEQSCCQLQKCVFFCLFSVGVFVLGEISCNCHYLNLQTASAKIGTELY